MKSLKSLLLYCVIFIFILTLTSSYEMDYLMNQKSGKYSLDSKVMNDLFYGTTTSIESSESEEQTENNSQSPTIEKELSLGDSGDEVFNYEKLLYYLDYIDSVPSGNFSEDMENAVKKFQEKKGMEATGILDVDTINLLTSEPIIYQLGKQGDEIKQYQVILYYLDYLKAYPGGDYGTSTAESVEKYQQDNGLSVTGNLDIITQDSLNQQEITYAKGKQGDNIKDFQTKLISLDYLEGTADGEFGAKTEDAVKDFQQENGLQVTGTINKETQDALNDLVKD